MQDDRTELAAQNLLAAHSEKNPVISSHAEVVCMQEAAVLI